MKKERDSDNYLSNTSMSCFYSYVFENTLLLAYEWVKIDIILLWVYYASCLNVEDFSPVHLSKSMTLADWVFFY